MTEVTKDITWIAMPGKNLAPGAATDLSVSLGPLPTVSSMPFTVLPTYANGTAGAAMPPVDVTLTPLTPDQAAAAGAAHAAHGGATGTSTAQDPDAGLFAQTVARAESGPSVWAVAGWVAAALAVLGAIGLALRRRHPAGADAGGEDEPPAGAPAEKEPVAAGGPRVTSWSYRDKPEG